MFLEIKRFLSCRMILSSSVPSSLDMLEVVQVLQFKPALAG